MSLNKRGILFIIKSLVKSSYLLIPGNSSNVLLAIFSK